jgi:hypothetical protein
MQRALATQKHYGYGLTAHIIIFQNRKINNNCCCLFAGGAKAARAGYKYD